MGLLSNITIYTSMVATMGGILSTPEPPTLPPPTVISSEASSDSDREVQATEAGSVTNHNLGKLEKLYSPSTIVNGIDIASHQHGGSSNMDITKVMHSKEVQFFFIKATEGDHYINPYFRNDSVSVINNDIPLGFYHYARPSTDEDDAKKQAQLFVKVTGMDKGVKAFNPVLDIEEDEGLSPRELIDWTESYVDEIKRLTGRDTMIYTYPSFWKDKMNNTTKFNNLPLWIADYNRKSSPSSLPGGWDKWTFWQYTDKEKITGVDAPVDGNVFNGSYKDLTELYK